MILFSSDLEFVAEKNINMNKLIIDAAGKKIFLMLIIKDNTYINDTDIIIGRTSNNNSTPKDSSIAIHHGDFGTIDGIYSHSNDLNNSFVAVGEK